MKYKYRIIETYSKSVEIDADSEDEAFEKVRDSYETGKIKFDYSDDFNEFEIFPQKLGGLPFTLSKHSEPK